MANEKVLPSLISLVNECSSLANASRYFRIIRIEKVQSTLFRIILFPLLLTNYFEYLLLLFNSLQFLDTVWAV